MSAGFTEIALSISLVHVSKMRSQCIICFGHTYQDFEAVVKLASVTELLIGEGQQTPVSIAFFTYSCA